MLAEQTLLLLPLLPLLTYSGIKSNLGLPLTCLRRYFTKYNLHPLSESKIWFPLWAEGHFPKCTLTVTESRPSVRTTDLAGIGENT